MSGIADSAGLSAAEASARLAGPSCGAGAISALAGSGAATTGSIFFSVSIGAIPVKVFTYR
ncbi:MAG: hypothetical protein AB7U47_05580 [Variibacter sp.]